VLTDESSSRPRTASTREPLIFSLYGGAF
jgi:hypothetical protein